MRLGKEHFILAVIFIIAVISRIIKFDAPDLVMDTVAYSRLGKNLIEYGRYAFGENYNMGVFFPPGYPVLIGLTNLFFHDLFFSAKLVSFISSCMSIYLAYLLGRELYNKEAGLFASLLFSIYPTILIISIQGYADAPFFSFLLLSIFVFIKTLRKNRIIYYLLIGTCFGITYLIRPEGLFLLLLPFSQIFGIFDEKIHLHKNHIIKFSFIFIVFGLIISPYIIFVKDYTGRFNLSGKGNISILLGKLSGDYNYHQIVNAPDNPYDRAAFKLTEDKTQLSGWNRKKNLSFKEYILGDLSGFLRRYQKNLLQEIYTLFKLLSPIALPLFFAFFYRDLFQNRQRFIFLVLPFIYFLMYPMFIIIEKQTLLIVLFLLIFSSGGFSKSKEVINGLLNYYCINNKRITHLLEKGIKPVIIVILIIGSLSYLRYSRFQHFDIVHAKPEEHKRAGHFLKEKLHPGYEELNIMGRKPYVSFYSDSRFTMLPYAPLDHVIQFARHYKVDFVVVDERSLSMWDYYNELLNMDRLRNDVELFYEDNTEKFIRLFRIKYQE